MDQFRSIHCDIEQFDARTRTQTASRIMKHRAIALPALCVDDTSCLGRARLIHATSLEPRRPAKFGYILFLDVETPFVIEHVPILQVSFVGTEMN